MNNSAISLVRRRLVTVLIGLGTVASTLQLLLSFAAWATRTTTFEPDYRAVEYAAKECRAYKGFWPRNLEEAERFFDTDGRGDPDATNIFLSEVKGSVVRSDIHSINMHVDFTPSPDGSCQVRYCSDYQGGFEVVHRIESPCHD